MVSFLVWIGAITVMKSASGFVFYHVSSWAVYVFAGVVVASPFVVYGAAQLIDLVGREACY